MLVSPSGRHPATDHSQQAEMMGPPRLSQRQIVLKTYHPIDPFLVGHIVESHNVE